MRLGLLSDLHLAPGRLNRCTSTARQLHGLLDALQRRSDRIVIVGDLYDLMRPRAPRGWRALLAAARQEHGAIAARLEACELVAGNHDEALGAPAERVYAARLRALVTHGHQFDPPIKRLPLAAEAANFAAGWFERARLGALAHQLGQVPTRLDRLVDSPDRLSVGAQALARDWDVVIVGHSHGLSLTPVGRGLVINTGSHTCGTLDAAWVDLDLGRAELWRDGAVVGRAERGEAEVWSLASL